MRSCIIVYIFTVLVNNAINPLPPEFFFFVVFRDIALFIYRLIVATLIGIFLMIPSKIESFAKRCHMGTLGGKGLMKHCLYPFFILARQRQFFAAQVQSC